MEADQAAEIIQQLSRIADALERLSMKECGNCYGRGFLFDFTGGVETRIPCCMCHGKGRFGEFKG